MKQGSVLVYLIRRDMRVADNPILHHLTTSTDHGYTHLLPIYIFDPLQIEVSGFLKDGEASPYPEARSAVGRYWRTGPHRAKFIAQSVWDLKQSLEHLNSGLLIQFGTPEEVVKRVIESMNDGSQPVGGVYMTEEKSSEEVDGQESVKQVCKEQGVKFKLWRDEKYFIDDRDTGLEKPSELPDIFTTYRKKQEPLRNRPRSPLGRPDQAKMLPLPRYGIDSSEDGPFIIPRTEGDCEARLLMPLKELLADPPPRPEGVSSAHPFTGGEAHGWERIEHLIKSGGMTKYKETRNGLLGPEFSTKLSAYLALGCITARQIHYELLKFEDGTDEKYKSGAGYGQGENEGTRGVRFELLWRDYMRLCTIKFGKRLFHIHGFRQKQSYDRHWRSANASLAPKSQSMSPYDVSNMLNRVMRGTTGLGLIDASQRELYHTGYTSNRARQNVASFLAKHLDIDWRYGAEWYEMLLVDYDVSSNWANWQYVAGVGNDPRGDERKFNPVKQAFDYDKEGAYVRSWLPELKGLERLECVFQVSTAKSWELASCGLENDIMVTDPVKRIQFVPIRKPKTSIKNQFKGVWRGGSKRGGGGGRGGGHGGTDQGNRSKSLEDTDHRQRQSHGESTAQENGSSNNGTQGETQHRGGHGGPARGGESMRDAFWFGNASPGKADGPSLDNANVQPDHYAQHYAQLSVPAPNWLGPRRASHEDHQMNSTTHGGYGGGARSEQGVFPDGSRYDDRRQWLSATWNGQCSAQVPPSLPPAHPPPVPSYSNSYYDLPPYPSMPAPGPQCATVLPPPPPPPQPWVIAGPPPSPRQVYPVRAEPMPSGSGFRPGPGPRTQQMIPPRPSAMQATPMMPMTPPMLATPPMTGQPSLAVASPMSVLSPMPWQPAMPAASPMQMQPPPSGPPQMTAFMQKAMPPPPVMTQPPLSVMPARPMQRKHQLRVEARPFVPRPAASSSVRSASVPVPTTLDPSSMVVPPGWRSDDSSDESSARIHMSVVDFVDRP